MEERSDPEAPTGDTTLAASVGDEALQQLDETLRGRGEMRGEEMCTNPKEKID